MVSVNVPIPKECENELNFIKAYVGMNEERAGEVITQNLLNGRKISKAILILHGKEHFGFQLRERAVNEIINERNIPLSIFCVDIKGEANEKEKIKEIIEEIIENIKNEKEVGLLNFGVRGHEICLNIQAKMKEMGLSTQVVQTGMDLNQKVVEGIIKGEILGSVIQHPFLQGKIAIEQAIKILEKNGENGEKKGITCFYTGPTWVDKNNILCMEKGRDF